MSFKVIERGTNRKLVYELLLVSTVTFAIPLTVCEIQAGLVLKTTLLPTPLVYDLEFEGHAVGMWRRNLAPEN